MSTPDILTATAVQPTRRANAKTLTSPYFASPPSRVSTTTQRSSPHFLKSPSSALGSLESLGPLIDAWTELKPPTCTRRCHETDAEQCTSCRIFIQDATRHFSSCPIFVESFQWKQLESMDDDSVPCMVHAGRLAEQSVRHLCANRCYLYAYSPARDWVALRKTLAEVTDQSIDALLQGWSCKLVAPTVDDEETDEEGQVNVIESRKRPRVENRPDSLCSTKKIRARTVYLSGEAKRYNNHARVLRALGQDNTIELVPSRIRKDAINQIHSAMITRRRLYQQKSDDSLVIHRPLEANDDLTSPLGLLEELFGDDPWQLLLSTIMLNRTQRKQVDGVLYQFLQRWPTAESIAVTNVDEISDLIAPIGIRFRRAQGIVKFSREYLDLLDRKATSSTSTGRSSRESPAFQLSKDEIQGLFHCGDYVSDAYKIFIQHDWTVNPKDHALRAYIEWKRGKQQHPSK